MRWSYKHPHVIHRCTTLPRSCNRRHTTSGENSIINNAPGATCSSLISPPAASLASVCSAEYTVRGFRCTRVCVAWCRAILILIKQWGCMCVPSNRIRMIRTRVSCPREEYALLEVTILSGLCTQLKDFEDHQIRLHFHNMHSKEWRNRGNTAISSRLWCLYKRIHNYRFSVPRFALQRHLNSLPQERNGARKGQPIFILQRPPRFLWFRSSGSQTYWPFEKVGKRGTTNQKQWYKWAGEDLQFFKLWRWTSEAGIWRKKSCGFVCTES